MHGSIDRLERLVGGGARSVQLAYVVYEALILQLWPFFDIHELSFVPIDHLALLCCPVVCSLLCEQTIVPNTPLCRYSRVHAFRLLVLSHGLIEAILGRLCLELASEL